MDAFASFSLFPSAFTVYAIYLLMLLGKCVNLCVSFIIIFYRLLCIQCWSQWFGSFVLRHTKTAAVFVRECRCWIGLVAVLSMNIIRGSKQIPYFTCSIRSSPYFVSLKFIVDQRERAISDGQSTTSCAPIHNETISRRKIKISFFAIRFWSDRWVFK